MHQRFNRGKDSEKIMIITTNYKKKFKANTIFPVYILIFLFTSLCKRIVLYDASSKDFVRLVGNDR